MKIEEDRMAFRCACGVWHRRSSYAIAQQAQGHVLMFTCPQCSMKMEVPPLEPRR